MAEIQVLPPQLTNQIAAGEVVERPASIVKELLENSIDAGATQIDVHIDKGGCKRILVRDNGCGIPKDELVLALTRHATSKIASLDDLDAITSLGFRGEALASISSVSRLTLTSRPKSQQEAWQAYAEGRNMDVTLKPAAHPVGSTIEVLDLFYNTPARRKFLRTEKTEFMHIEECIKRIALTKATLQLTLFHNGKKVKHIKATNSEQSSAMIDRLTRICGSAFTQSAYPLTCQHQDMNIHGFILPEPARAEPLHYFYINGRMIKDKMLNHAIRQAYQTFFNQEWQPSYLLYLILDPYQVDINVHPAKHEVRFHQSRLVHDFVYHAVLSTLHKIQLPVSSEKKTEAKPEIPEKPRSLPVVNTKNRVAAGYNSFTVSKNTSDPNKKNSTQLQEEQQLYQQLCHSNTQIKQEQVPVSTLPTKMAESSATLIPHQHMMKSEMEMLFRQASAHSFGQVLTIIQSQYALIEHQGQLSLLSLNYAQHLLLTHQLSQSCLSTETLLVPVTITLTESEKQHIKKNIPHLTSLNIDLQFKGMKLIIHAVPTLLRNLNWQQFFLQLIPFIDKHDMELSSSQLMVFIVRQAQSLTHNWAQAKAIQLLAELEHHLPHYVSSPPKGLLHPIDVTLTIQHLMQH